MNALNNSILKGPEANLAHIERCESEIKSQKTSKINDFFANHETSRKIVTKLTDLVLVGAFLINYMTTRKLHFEMGISLAIALTTIRIVSSLAESPPHSLKEKKVACLN